MMKFSLDKGVVVLGENEEKQKKTKPKNKQTKNHTTKQ